MRHTFRPGTADPSNPATAETLNGIYESPADKEHYEAEFAVNSKNTVKWLWQQAETLKTVTDEDRAAIVQLIDGLARSLREKDWEGVRKCYSQPWGDGPCPSGIVPQGATFADIERKELDLAKKVFAYPDFTVTVAKPRELEFIPGERCVFVTTKPVADPQANNEIVAAGHAPGFRPKSGEFTYSLSQDKLHFLKVDGRWRLLH